MNPLQLSLDMLADDALRCHGCDGLWREEHDGKPYCYLCRSPIVGEFCVLILRRIQREANA